MAFKYIECFAGIGGFRRALDTLGGDCVFASEIDPFATRAYKALYDGAPELNGDITQIDANDIPDHDVLVGGFPCQAFSVAGQRKGFEEARGTLFFEIARIASAKQPRLMLLENVKGLLSHDGGKTFETMCVVLNDIGYAIDFRVLNSKHYGVPQNRERIFIVCDRDAEHAEWNIAGNGVEANAKRRAQDLGIRTFNFDWPTNDKVTTRLRDILEDNVEERYYLSEEKTAKLITQLKGRKSEVEDVVCVNPRKTAQDKHGVMFVYREQLDADIREIVAKSRPNDEIGITYKDNGDIRPHRMDAKKSGISELNINHEDNPSFTVTSAHAPKIYGETTRYRIRKLTPRECWRLQGFTDETFEKAKYYSEEDSRSIITDARRKGKRDIPDETRAERLSDSQLYKQAGNAVTVNVISAIGKRMIPLLDENKTEVTAIGSV